MENEKKATNEVQLRNYLDYKEQTCSSNVTFGKESTLEYVAVGDILPIVYSHPYWNENNPNFWYHHAKAPEDYDDLARKYQVIRTKMEEGASLNSLAAHKDLRLAIDCWWSKRDPVRLVKFKSSYFVVSGLHRVALAMKHNLTEIPAVVSEARLKKQA
ncbi:MAG: hypothetical protein ACLPX5_12825 [Dissulfurispiraceae bacterium]